jgi:hypothetical protein
MNSANTGSSHFNAFLSQCYLPFILTVVHFKPQLVVTWPFARVFPLEFSMFLVSLIGATCPARPRFEVSCYNVKPRMRSGDNIKLNLRNAGSDHRKCLKIHWPGFIAKVGVEEKHFSLPGNELQ